MANLTFETIYALKDRFSGPSRQAADAADDFAKSAGSASSAAQKVGGSGGPVIQVLRAIATAGLGAAAAFTGISIAAGRQAASFDSIKRAFAGLLGDFDQAGQMMEYIEQYALRSAFGLSDLAAAGLQLGQAGLSVGRFLPIVEALALATGNVTPEGLLDVASVLRRIQGGQIAEGLGPEGLGRFGLNRNTLMEFGARFDRSGRFEGGTDEALALVERVVSQRLRPMADLVGQGDEAKWSNIADALQKAVREFGNVVNKRMLGGLVEGAQVIGYLAKSGAVERWSESIFAASRIVFGGKNSLAYNLLFLGQMASAASKALGIIASLVRLGPIGNAWKTLTNNLRERTEREYEKFLASQKDQGDASAPETARAKTITLLERVARAVEDTAINTRPDFRRAVLGGGELAQMGISPIEMRGASSNSAVRQGSRDLASAIEAAMMQMLLDLRRQGAV